MRVLLVRLPTRRNLALSALLLIALLPATAPQAGNLTIIDNSRWVGVSHVVDGDTFTTRSGEKVRLLGINTPEIAHGNNPGQPLGQKAKQRLQQLIAGKTVQLRTDKDRHDAYGRLLAEVYLPDGTWVNAKLVREGLAHVYTFAPNFRWAGELQKAEHEAIQRHVGLWNNPRFRILQAEEVDSRLIGEFRVVEGTVSLASKWRFRLGKLEVSVPRKYRQWFRQPLIENGQHVRVRATLRTSSHGNLFAAVHTPFDLEVLK